MKFQSVQEQSKLNLKFSKHNYTIEPIETKAALKIVIKNHYLHRAAPCSKAYGIFEIGGYFGGVLKGVICYGVPAYNCLLYTSDAADE